MPTFDEFAQRAQQFYPQATEAQIREAWAAKYGGTAVRSQGPSKAEYTARARELYPDIGDEAIDEAYEAKYGAGFATETKRTLLSQAYAPLVQGVGAISGGLDRLFGWVPGTGLFDTVGEALFQHGERIRQANAPSADVASRSPWNPYRLGQNVIGGLGQIAPAVLTGGATLAPLVAADAGSLATELEDEGMDAGEARARATGYAAASSLLERVGLGRLIPKRIAGRIAAGAQEAGTEIAQGVARNVAASDDPFQDIGQTIAGEGIPAGLAAAILAPGRQRGRQQEFVEDTGLDVSRGTSTPDVPSAEPLADIRAQIQELGKTRRGVFIPKGQEGAFPDLPGVDLPTGRMVTRSQEDAATFADELAQGDPQAVIGAWTGAGTGKPTDPNAAVVQAYTRDGAVIRESAVPRAEVPATVKRFEQELGGLIRVVTPAQALQRRQELLKGEQSAFSQLPPEELERRVDPAAAAARVKAGPLPKLASLPKSPAAYFKPTATSTQVPVANLLPDHFRAGGTANALKMMAAASEGRGDKRKPIRVKVDRLGQLHVLDGNSTLAAAKLAGVQNVEAEVELDLADDTFRELEGQLTAQQKLDLAAQVRDAAQFKGQLDADLEAIAAQVGGTAKSGGLKADHGFGRIVEKVLLEQAGDTNLKDMARGTIVVDTREQAQAALAAIENRFGVAPGTTVRRTLVDADSLAEVIAMDPAGYADVKVNIPAPNGRVYEIQIASKDLLRAKERGHKVYQKIRSREGKAVESLRKIYGRLDTDQAKRALAAAVRMFKARDPEMQKLYAESRRIYVPVLERWFTRASNSSAEISPPSALIDEAGTKSQAPSGPMSTPDGEGSAITAGLPSTDQNVEPAGQSADGRLSAIPITSEASVARDSHRVITPGGREIEVRGRVVSLDDLITSDQEGYPSELQPRERGKRAALTSQVQKIARELRPWLLGQSATTAEGGPIVSPEGVVESGNGRVMALRLARAQHPENWQAYQDWVAQQGLDTEGIQDPVFIQERVTPLAPEELRNYTADANESTAARLSPTEQAISDARLLDEELLSKVLSGDMSQAQNTDFLRAFIAKLPDAARNALVAANGQITPAGVQRAEAALVARAYGGSPEISTLLDRLYEDTSDETVKRITNALKTAAYKFVELKLGIDTGRVDPAYDIGPAIVRAYDAVQKGRRDGQSPADIAGQGDLLDDGGLRQAILSTFYRKLEPGAKNEWPQDKVAGQLMYYAQQAAAQRTDQAGMFAPIPPLDILETAHRLAGDKKGASAIDQFARKSEAKGEGAMTVASLRQFIAPIVGQWRNGPRIRVVQSAWELPSHILEELGTDITGASDLSRGTVYLVAENIRGRWQAERVLLHEAVGHFGFDRLYGDRFPGLVDQVMGLVGKDAEITKLERDIRGRYGDLDRPTMAAEIVAHLAERSPKHPFAKRALAQFRELLRALGFRINLSKADLVHLLQRSAESMRERDRQPRAPLEPAGGQAYAARARGYNSDQLNLDFLTPSEQELLSRLPTRAGMTIDQARVGLAALRDLITRTDARRGAEVIHDVVPKDFIEQGSAALIGQRIGSHHDLAQLAQVYRDPRFETLRFIFMRGNTVVHETAFSSRLPGMVGFAKVGGVDLDPFKFLAKVKADSGADGYYLLHNHPSGNPRPSEADERFTERASLEVAGFRAHVVIDHKAYGHIMPGGFVEVVDSDELAGYDIDSSVQEGRGAQKVSADWLGKVITGPEQLVKLGKVNENPEALKDSAIIVGSDGRGYVRMVTKVPYALLQGTRGLARLRLMRVNSGSTRLFGIADDVQKLRPYFDNGILLDVVDTKSFAGRIGAQRGSLMDSASVGLTTGWRRMARGEMGGREDPRTRLVAEPGFGRPTDEAGRQLDQQGRVIPEGQQELAVDTGAREQPQAPDFALERPEGQVRPPSQQRLFAARPASAAEFRRWFGKSKVVTGSGNPKLVYHGSPVKGIDTFKPGRGGMIFTTDSRSYAEEYLLHNTGDDANVIALYARIENPADLDNDPRARAIAIENFNENNWRDVYDDDTTAQFDPEADDTWELTESPTFVQAMRAAGYDGAVFKEGVNQITGRTYVVFDPGQLKSATANSGAYDREKQSIFASRPTGQAFQGTGFGTGATLPPDPAERPVDAGGGTYQLGQFRGLDAAEQQLLTSVMGDLDQDIEGQRRGTRDWDTTERAALTMLRNRTGLTLDSLVRRKRGSTANAEQLEAYGMVIAQTTREVKAIADRVNASRNPSSADLAALHGARERLGMLIAPAMGYATEAGRSLNILRKVSGDLRDADRILEALGDGSEGAIKQFAKAVAQADNPDQVIGVTRASYTPNLWDKFYEVWINGLLSGPTTHAVNVTSNGIFNLLELGAEAVASIFSKAVPMRSVAAKVAAVPHGVMFGLKNARISWRDERAVLTAEDKLETHDKAIGGLAGKIVRAPGRALQAEDELFKGVAYSGQLAALAMDEAVRIAPDDPRPVFDRIMGNIQAHPELIKKAKDHAARVTFTSPLGDLGRVAMRFANSKVLGMRPLRLIIPFIRTPSNILKRALEYTPAAPAFEQVRKDLSGGGRDAAMAWSRMAIGTTIGMTFVSLAAQGMLSGAGPEDEGERALLMRQGWRPYSFRRQDGSWVKYNRFEPVGMLLGIAADLYELSGPLKQGEYEKLASMLVTSIANNLGDKTFLRGITEAAQAYSDPQRYMARWVNGLASSVVPNIVGQTVRWQDPYVREARTILDSLRAKLPGESQRLARRLDIAGDPIERDTGMPGNPLATSKPKQDILADTMLHLGVSKNAPSRNIVVAGKDFELGDADYTSYKSFVQKARWNVLTPLVSSPQFRQLASTNPQAAQMLLDKQYDDIGRQARMAWLFQNSRALVPKQPSGSSLATSYR